MSDQERREAAAKALMEAAERASAGIGRQCAAIAEALAAWARAWPPERIIASAITEHNRRMDEFNGRSKRHE